MPDYSKYYEDDHRRGAGGPEGGVGRFFLGIIMIIAGIYLLLNNIHVGSSFGMGGGGGGFGRPMFNVGGRAITSGFVMIPFIFGVGMIFYNHKNYFGWVLAIASVIMLMVGVITSTQFHFNSLSAFDLIIILVLFIGGVGLFLSSLRSVKGNF